MSEMLAIERDFARPLSKEELSSSGVNGAHPAEHLAPVMPVPADAPRPVFRHGRLGKPSSTWTYADASGAVLGYACRFDPPGESKQILPHTLWRGPAGPKWLWRQFADPRPLYGLDQLAARSATPVIVVEGEKCAEAARLVFPKSVVVTSPGGSNATDKTDWAPLAGRRVLIWPDADMPGNAYANKVASIVSDLGASDVRILDAVVLGSRTPEGEARATPEGWDVADALNEGWDPEALRTAALALAHRFVPGPRYVSFANFTMAHSGLTAEVTRGKGDNARLEDLWVSAPFEVIGRARDPAGHGWSKWLAWKDPDGRRHEYAVTDAALHGDLGALASEFASRGLAVSRAARVHLADYLNRVDVSRRVTTVGRTGWHEIAGAQVFVLPDEVIGAPLSESVILNGATAAPYGFKGSLADWTNGVGQLVAGHSRLVLTVSAAFAGPLLSVAGAEGGGINFHGLSSKGKTTALQAAASVWGRGATDPGFVRSWRATANATEGVAALVTDTCLCLDEIGVTDGRDAAAAVYQLATGVGKGRAGRDGSLRSPATWRVLTLSTGETTMAAKITEDRNRRAFAGQAVRLLDIPADAGKGFGIFDHAGLEDDAGKLSDAIKHAATSAFGTAGPAFVRRLVSEDLLVIGQLVHDMVAAFQEAHLPGDADGQIKRAAARLGLIGAAGELARGWGLVPWQEGEATQAAASALADWIVSRGGTEPAEVREAIAQVRRFFEAHGEARFEPIDGGGESGDGRPTLNRVGWRKGYGDSRVWYVLPELWKSEVAVSFDPAATARALADRGILLPDDQGRKLQRVTRTPYGPKRVYVVTAAIFEGGE